MQEVPVQEVSVTDPVLEEVMKKIRALEEQVAQLNAQLNHANKRKADKRKRSSQLTNPTKPKHANKRKRVQSDEEKEQCLRECVSELQSQAEELLAENNQKRRKGENGERRSGIVDYPAVQKSLFSTELKQRLRPFVSPKKIETLIRRTLGYYGECIFTGYEDFYPFCFWERVLDFLVTKKRDVDLRKKTKEDEDEGKEDEDEGKEDEDEGKEDEIADTEDDEDDEDDERRTCSYSPTYSPTSPRSQRYDDEGSGMPSTPTLEYVEQVAPDAGGDVDAPDAGGVAGLGKGLICFTESPEDEDEGKEDEDEDEGKEDEDEDPSDDDIKIKPEPRCPPFPPLTRKMQKDLGIICKFFPKRHEVIDLTFQCSICSRDVGCVCVK